jgi:hypothetical protein
MAVVAGEGCRIVSKEGEGEGERLEEGEGGKERRFIASEKNDALHPPIHLFAKPSDDFTLPFATEMKPRVKGRQSRQRGRKRRLAWGSHGKAPL